MVAGGLSGCAGSDAAASPQAHALRIVAGHCVAGWTPSAAGIQHYVVDNRTADEMRVSLVGAENGDIYGQIWELAARTSRPLDTVVPAGRYRFRCVPLQGSASVSAIRAVRGSGGTQARPIVPLSAEEITGAVATYRGQVAARLGPLVAATDRLTDAVRGGQLAAARRWWLPAHLDYERLGAAYGTFGDLDARINGRPDGLPGRADSPRFTGFLRLEHGLWHGGSATALRPVATDLAAAVRRLRARFGSLATNPGDLPLRAHEILENTLQFELTGDTDQGAHTNLATAQANVDGARLVIDALAKPLRQRDPRLLATSYADLTRMAGALDRFRRTPSRWTALSMLTAAEREQLNALLSQALEDLALIPGTLQMPPSTAPT
jgi:high-affinity iron transporter